MSKDYNLDGAPQLATSAQMRRLFGVSELRCPNPDCHRMSFKVYVYPDGSAVDPDCCGRCNHESSCGYHVPPREYFKMYPDKCRYSSMSAEERREQERKRREDLAHEAQLLAMRKYLNDGSVEDTEETAPEQMYIPLEYVLPTLERFEISPLYRFLCSRYPEDKVREVFSLYHVGADKYGNTIFWQTDMDGCVRSGKIIPYMDNGHRNKSAGWTTSWMHARLEKQLPDGWQLHQCMFGEHLIDQDSSKKYMVVESEKSALIGSIELPQYVWLSVGSKQNFKYEILRPLADHGQICVLPDLGAYDEWKQRAADIYGIELLVSDLLEAFATDKARAGKMDIADYLLGEF